MPVVIRNLDTRERVRPLSPVDSGADATGGTALEPTSCCGGAAPGGIDACCALDADVKSAGGSGCGCGSPAAPTASGCC